MKNLILLFILFIGAINLSAQDSLHIKEAGITIVPYPSNWVFGTNGGTNYGITYKCGKVKSLWRFTALQGISDRSKEENDSVSRKYSDNRFQVKAGREYRKNIAPKLQFKYGFDLGFLVNQSDNSYTNKNSVSNSSSSSYFNYGPMGNFVFGFNYFIKEKIVIGIEIQPFFSYTIGTRDQITGLNTEKYSTSTIQYGLNSTTSGIITIAYQFHKKS